LKDIASFEFEPTMRENGSGMGNAMALLNAFIYSQAEKHHLSSVGGSVIAIENNSDGYSYIVTGRTYSLPMEVMRQAPPNAPLAPELLNSILIQGNNIYREVGGTRYKLIPVSEYRPSGTGKMML
jgi:hypothetical protein